MLYRVIAACCTGSPLHAARGQRSGYSGSEQRLLGVRAAATPSRRPMRRGAGYASDTKQFYPRFTRHHIHATPTRLCTSGRPSANECRLPPKRSTIGVGMRHFASPLSPNRTGILLTDDRFLSMGFIVPCGRGEASPILSRLAEVYEPNRVH
jgi:hypothetical protein